MGLNTGYILCAAQNLGDVTCDPPCSQFAPQMPPQHAKTLHSGDWMSHSNGMMPMSTKQTSKYGGLLPLETPKGIPGSWLSCSLFRIRGAQKSGLEKDLRRLFSPTPVSKQYQLLLYCS